MSEQSLVDVVADAHVRARALDATTSFIVQAPAGSGKTELLTQRYLRLLATVEQPEQVLAITFTRKAAAEMRARILKALHAGGGPPPSAPHALKTWELAQAVRVLDARQHWDLLRHPARLRVQTIDALNASLARRLPILSGAGAGLEPTTEPAALHRQACEALLERLGDGSREGTELEVLIKHLGNRVEQLVALLVDLLAQRDQWLHEVVQAGSTENLRAVLERVLGAVVERHLQRVCDRLLPEQLREWWQLLRFSAKQRLGGAELSDAKRAVFEECWRVLKPPGAQSTDLPYWLALTELLIKSDGDVYKQVNVKQGFPKTEPAAKKRMEHVLEELAANEELCALLLGIRDLPQPTFAEEQWRVLEALLVILPVAVAELRWVFQVRGQVDYVETALRALTALGTADEPTDLALVFDYRLRHILVDEFQDTSFSQLELLERLTAGWEVDDGRTLFCVGDPMQSIYRFRQAEVGLFIELQRGQGIGNVVLTPLTLSTNFRSTRPVVAWLNEVFPGVLAPRNDPERGAVTYSPSVANSRDESGGLHIHPGIEHTNADEAREVCDIVRGALARDAHGSVAILVAGRAHLGDIASALTAADIPFQAVEIEHLSERPIVQDLLALTRALNHLGDRAAWLAVLRAPWCGLLLADLHVLASHSDESTLSSLLSSEATFAALSVDGRARLTRIHQVLLTALAERGRYGLRDWVERTWNALDGPAVLTSPQDLADAEAFFHRLEEIDARDATQDLMQLEAQLADLYARPRASQRRDAGTEPQARVEVMTIHKAKGLEFDTVIVPGLERGPGKDGQRLLRLARLPSVAHGLVLAPVKADGAAEDSVYHWLKLLDAERGVRERGRLLYVAATRARRDLHLMGRLAMRQSADGAVLEKPRNGSMLQMLWPAVSGAFAEAFDALAREPAPASPPPAPLLVRRMPLDWVRPAADPPVAAASSGAIPYVSIERPDFDWASETSRHVGTLVHRELERLAQMAPHSLHPGPADKLEVNALWRSAATRARLRIELAELGIPAERCDAALTRVVLAIDKTLADAKGRWLLGLTGTLREAHSELRLTGVVDGQLVDGAIDRTFVDERGTRWIVDFKTSTHTGGGLTEFLDNEVARYRPQLARYARLVALLRPEPIKAALYFPLLSVWREVFPSTQLGFVRGKQLDLFR